MPLLLAALAGAAVAEGGLTADTLIGFGVAAPVVTVFAYLMAQAFRARDAAQAAHLADLRTILPAIDRSNTAQEATAAALAAWADRYDRDLRERGRP